MVLSLWGLLSDERVGSSFVAADKCHKNDADIGRGDWDRSTERTNISKGNFVRNIGPVKILFSMSKMNGKSFLSN
jgi:hypothetical protein